MSEFSRYEMPESVKNLIKVAVETRAYDMIEVYAAAVNFGTDWKALTQDIVEVAFSQRHCPGDIHGQVAKAADLVYVELAA
jgi:TRAP-type mannitol/chloroaromatic compound transport system substrate-binding protein